MPISYQVITVHQGNDILAPQMSLGKTAHVLSPKMARFGGILKKPVICLPLFGTFCHVTNLKNAFSVESLYHKDSNMFRPLSKVKPCSDTPCCNNLFFIRFS